MDKNKNIHVRSTEQKKHDKNHLCAFTEPDLIDCSSVEIGRRGRRKSLAAEFDSEEHEVQLSTERLLWAAESESSLEFMTSHWINDVNQSGPKTQKRTDIPAAA